MRKRNKHPGRAEPEQPLSAGRVEYIEAARQRVRSRKVRRTAVVVIALAAVVAFTTGLVGTSVMKLKDMVDSAAIALMPDAGWPQNTGVQELIQAETLSDCFVELGDESCVIYSDTGSRLNSIQSGYARPAIAVGKTRFALYNRSGNELRVESRTQNLYTKVTDDAIYLCAVANDGKLAVVTDDVRGVAKLLLYSASMEQQLSWETTGTEGMPLRIEFSPDSRNLAVAAVAAGGGQVTTNLYVLPVGQGDPILAGTQNGTPQYIRWLSNNTLLVIYDSCAAVYYAGGGTRAQWDFSGKTLASASVGDEGSVALLFTSGQTCEAASLDRDLNLRFEGGVPSAHRIVSLDGNFYLLTDSGAECFDSSGNFQWRQELEVRPQALLKCGGRLLVFCGNTVQILEPPQEDAASSGS